MPFSNTSAQCQHVSTQLKILIEKNHIDVPILPEVAGKAVRLTQDSESTSSELAKLIQSDQTLAGHVMRVANSAAYSPNASILTLQQAITRLGMKMIAEIALAASINSSLFDTPGFENYIECKLKFSLATALWAKEVARACRHNVEAAFLAGLLHDIGRPVAIQDALIIARKAQITLTKEELFILEDTFQRPIGIRVIELWKMPSSVQSAVKYFDNYSAAHPSQNQTLSIVAGSLFARHFTNASEENQESEEGNILSRDDLFNHPVFSALNLYPDELEKLIEKIDNIRAAMEAMGNG